MIQFRFNPRKALQAVEWMLAEVGDAVDFHTLLKTCYFADKQMLNDHGRPIFGASYRAMNYGPVPLEIYEMLKCEPIWLAELDLDEYPWTRESFRTRRDPVRNALPDTDFIAEREKDAISEAFAKCREMTFTERTRETHGMDWVEGTRRPGGRMAYEDMISPDHPERAALIDELETMGPRIAL